MGRIGSLGLVLLASGALASCGTPAADVASAPIQKAALFHSPPGELATCFQASYAGRLPETMTFDLERVAGGHLRLYALMYGTSNDLLLAKRYYWVMDLQGVPGGTEVSLRSRPDWAGIDRAGPEVWQILATCAGNTEPTTK